MVIREANINDIDNNLLSLLIQGYNLHYINRPDKFYKRTNERLKEILIEMLNSENILIIEVDNKIIGYVSYQFKEKNNNKSLWIDELVIDDKFQGKGYGKNILNELESIAKNKDCSSVELCCWTFNENALGMYKHIGFNEQRVILEKKVKQGEV